MLLELGCIKLLTHFKIKVGGPNKLSFRSKDCQNYIEKTRRLQLAEEDAEAMHRYFMKMKANNEDFFYAFDFNEKGRLRNIFWADERSRAASKKFGHVVTFDTHTWGTSITCHLLHS